MNSNSTATSNFDIDRKLSQLLREHVVFKFTKTEKKSYKELLNFGIEMEITNNELQRKIENLKKETYMYNQSIVDLNIELEECKIKNKSLLNQLRIMERARLDVGNEVSKHTDDSQQEKKSDELDYSISNTSIEDLSIDNDLLGTMKKKKKIEVDLERSHKKLKEDNKSLLDDLNMLVNEIKKLRGNIEEKDNIISILYQEVENLKSSSNMNENENEVVNKNPEDSPIFNRYNKEKTSKKMMSSSLVKDISDSKSHLNNLELIKESLLNFLKNYGINEDFSKMNNSNILNKNSSNSNEIEYVIEMRMNEIKYILINLKKLNIIFKSLFMEFSKNLMTMFQTEMERINNNKVAKMQNKIRRIAITLNKYINK